MRLPKVNTHVLPILTEGANTSSVQPQELSGELEILLTSSEKDREAQHGEATPQGHPTQTDAQGGCINATDGNRNLHSLPQPRISSKTD